MRIPRLLIIVGPAAVLYVLAARASSDAAQSADWFVASSALACSLLPLAYGGMRPSRSISAVALMGTSVAVALASARTSDVWLRGLHGVAWLACVSIVLGFALPPRTSGRVRVGAIMGFVGCAALAGLASVADLAPSRAFGVVVVAGLLPAAALHQVALTRRGRAVEGGLSAFAMVALAVGLGCAWLGSWEGALGGIVEAGVGAMLLLGHLAWVDPRWRVLRRFGIPLLIASTVAFLLAYAWAPGRPIEPWEQGAAAVVVALVWWLAYVAARRLSRLSLWSTSERFAEVVSSALRGLHGTSDLDAVAAAVLTPLGALSADSPQQGEIITFEPPLRIRLASGGRVESRTAEAPGPIVRALGRFSAAPLDLVVLRARAVREPDVRELVDLMESRELGAIVPCIGANHLEGLLVLPLVGRTDPLSGGELESLVRLSRALGIGLSSALAERRAQNHIHEASELRRDAEARVTVLEHEVEQLRGQCEALGRGFAEDPSLHVAYSPSMRRVQTRAIELATDGRPLLLRGAPGSPMLQVARFIHDRGPRWEAQFIVVDCAVTPPEEAMTRMFGTGQGRAGWFGTAAGGTLLFRDLPALPRDVQVVLAERLEGLEVGDAAPTNPRVIATVRQAQDERDPILRVDPALFRCLDRNTLLVPSLRERREDVPSLVLLAVDRACRVLARDPVGIDQAAMAALVEHDWPGDVAELELVIQLAVARVRNRTIGVADLPPLAWASAPLEEALDGTYMDVERRLLQQALRVAGGNKSKAARRLGLKRTTFLDKLRRHGLEKRLEGDVGGSALG